MMDVLIGVLLGMWTVPPFLWAYRKWWAAWDMPTVEADHDPREYDEGIDP